MLPYAWAVNGLASVVASVLGVAIALFVGFRVTTLVAAACYGAALLHAGLGRWALEQQTLSIDLSADPPEDPDTHVERARSTGKTCPNRNTDARARAAQPGHFVAICTARVGHCRRRCRAAWLEGATIRTRVSIGVVAVASVVAGVVLPLSAPGGAVAAAETETTPAAFQPAVATTKVPVRSTYETNTRVVSRDGGESVELPDGHDLWIFGDTDIYRRTGSQAWESTKFIDGSTAVLTRTTRGSAPAPGAEQPTGAPKRFIPVPNDVYLPNGSGRACNHTTAAYAARWPTGAAVLGKAEVIVSYSIVCVTKPGGTPTLHVEGWGYLLYNWKTRHIDHGPADVFRPANGRTLAAAHVFGSPVVKKQSVTFFSSQCTRIRYVGCANGSVWSATMPARTGVMDRASSYKLHPLVTDRSGTLQPLAISVERYGGTLRLLTTSSIVGDYQIFTARRVGDRWHLASAGKLPGCPTQVGFCFSLEGHPELSVRGRMFVSYYDPDSGPGGHVVVSALPFPA